MNIQEEIIKSLMYCEPGWVSFSNGCQCVDVSSETINKSIGLVVYNDALNPVKKLLRTDFGFMFCLYPLIYLLLMQLITLYDKVKQERLILWIKILAYCQFLSLAADIAENIMLLQNLEKDEFRVLNVTINIIEYVKWGFASIGVLVFIIATIIWAIGFVRETEKASADVNY